MSIGLAIVINIVFFLSIGLVWAVILVPPSHRYFIIIRGLGLFFVTMAIVFFYLLVAIGFGVIKF